MSGSEPSREELLALVKAQAATIAQLQTTVTQLQHTLAAAQATLNRVAHQLDEPEAPSEKPH